MGCALQQWVPTVAAGNFCSTAEPLASPLPRRETFCRAGPRAGEGCFLRASSRLHRPEDSQLPGDSQLTYSG